MWDVNGGYGEVRYDSFKIMWTTWAINVSGFVEPNKYGLRDDLSSVNGANFSSKTVIFDSTDCPERALYNSPGWYECKSRVTRNYII
jgi:hypothetical protein